MRRDPVMQHCRKQSVPIIWDQQTYIGQGLGDLWEQQAQFGYRTGIAMALHLPEGRHFVLGVDRDKPLPADAEELQRVVADLQLFAVHAQDAAMRLLVPEPMQPETPSLTPRELEALRWTMEGKTAWEVGAMLGISERTAVLHVNNAMHKLGCVNKHQAVLKALRLGPDPLTGVRQRHVRRRRWASLSRSSLSLAAHPVRADSVDSAHSLLQCVCAQTIARSEPKESS